MKMHKGRPFGRPIDMKMGSDRLWTLGGFAGDTDRERARIPRDFPGVSVQQTDAPVQLSACDGNDPIGGPNPVPDAAGIQKQTAAVNKAIRAMGMAKTADPRFPLLGRQGQLKVPGLHPIAMSMG